MERFVPVPSSSCRNDSSSKEINRAPEVFFRRFFCRGNRMEEKVALILPAGGTSSRFGQGNKLLCPLKGMPVFCHSIRNFSGVVPFRNMILPVNAGFRKEFQEAVDRCFPGKGIRIVEGGATRTESVYRALKALSGSYEFVAVHDAARPLADADLFRRCVEGGRVYGAALAAHRVVDTVKVMGEDGLLSAGGIDREKLWAVETPQIFRYSDLLFAAEHAMRSGMVFTDDAAAVEKFCHRGVFPVENTRSNLKITRASDLILAEQLL